MTEPWAYLRHLARRGTANIHPLGRSATTRLLQALHVRESQRVLELGCGTGETLAAVASRRGVKAGGVDLLPEMLAAARTRLRACGTRATLAQADATRLPFASGTCDRVFCESVLGFQGEKEAAALLHEVRRVLVPLGRFVCLEAVWKVGTPPEEVSRIHAAQVEDFGLCQASPQAWDVEGWAAAMRAAGLAVRYEPLAPNATASPEEAPSVPLRTFLATRLVSRVLRVRAAMSGAAEERAWRGKLARHAAFGARIEAYLFVLEKPGV